jgi:hypothetical protein
LVQDPAPAADQVLAAQLPHTAEVLPAATLCAAKNVPAAHEPLHAPSAVVTRVPAAQDILHAALDVPEPEATAYPVGQAVQDPALAADQVLAAQLPHAAEVLPAATVCAAKNVPAEHVPLHEPPSLVTRVPLAQDIVHDALEIPEPALTAYPVGQAVQDPALAADQVLAAQLPHAAEVLPAATVCAAKNVPAPHEPLHAPSAVATRVPAAQETVHDALDVPAPALTTYPDGQAVQDVEPAADQ